MALNASPNKKWTLRTTVKPPKPFAGDVPDDPLSTSILGDRILATSEMEGVSGPVRLNTPAGEQSKTSQNTMTGNMQSKKAIIDTSPGINKDETPTKSYLRREPSVRLRSTTPRLMPKCKPLWAPGLGKTPAKNKKYLGPQTDYNANLPPAAFPTTDTNELARAWQRSKSPYAASRLSDSIDSRTPVSAIHNYNHAKDVGAKDNVTGLAPGTPTFQGSHSFWKSSASPARNPEYQKRAATDIWDELSVYYRLVLVDSYHAASRPPGPNAHEILCQFRLTAAQVAAMKNTLRDRSRRNEAEDGEQRQLNNGVKRSLMNSKASFSQDDFTSMLGQTIYKHLHKDDHLETKPNDLQNARLFLTKVGLNVELLYDAIPPLTPFQQLLERLMNGQDSRPSDYSQQCHTAARNTQTATVSTTPSKTTFDQQPPPPTRSTARTWDNDSALLAPAQLNQIQRLRPNFSPVTPVDKPSPRGPPSEEQDEHRDQAVQAAPRYNEGLRAGPEMTGGSGIAPQPLRAGRHVTMASNESKIIAESTPVGNLDFDEWVIEMDRRYHNGQRLLERSPRDPLIFMDSTVILEETMRGPNWYL